MNKRIIIILLLIPFFVNGQVVSDARLWTGATVTKKIKKLELSFSEEIRFDENISHIDKIFTEIGGEYKLMKGLYGAINYRFSKDNDYENRGYDIQHRIDIGLTYKRKLDKFRFSLRSKYQTASAPPYENNPTYLRNKLVVQYDLDKPYTPFVYYEFFYQFNDEKVINRTRLSLGGKYKLNKKSSLKMFYIYENKFNIKNLKHNHIWGVSYSFDL